MRFCCKVTAVAACLAVTSGSALAQYRLQSGDVIEVAVAGLPDLGRRSSIDIDGRATFPLVPAAQLAGLTLAEAEAVLRRRYADQLFQSRTPDGREIAIAISPQAVTVAIAEYRPVYVNGDVSKPGAQTFRPGLTVRQAVALAGGYDVVRFRMGHPLIEAADLSGEYQSLWIEHASLTARIWRLETELRGATTAPEAPDTPAPVAPAVLASIRALASQELAARQESALAGRRHIEDAIQRADQQLVMLEQRRQDEDEGTRADGAEYSRLAAFSQRGSLPTSRLADARRLVLISSSQALQTRVQIAQVQRERAATQRELQVLVEKARLETLKALDLATAELGKARAKLASVADKMTFTGQMLGQMSGGAVRKPTIHIVYPGGGQAAADEDTLVAPGDTIEISVAPHATAPVAAR